MDSNLLILDVVLITFSFLLSLYNFSLFLINKEDTTPLKLMVFILVGGVVRTFLKGDAGTFNYYFPSVLEAEKMRAWVFLAPVGFLGLFYFLATMAKPWKRLLPIYQIFVVLFCIWVIFVPFHFLKDSLRIAGGVFVLGLCYFSVLLLKESLNKNMEALGTLIFLILIIVITIFNRIFFQNSILYGSTLAHLSLILFFSMHSIFLLLKQNDFFKEQKETRRAKEQAQRKLLQVQEHKNRELAEKNEELTETKQELTETKQELTETKQELTETKQRLLNVEKEVQKLNPNFNS